MYAVHPPPLPGRADSSSYHGRLATMSRVPIASLLRSDEGAKLETFSENDRTYYRFQNETYLYPADDEEFERLDIMHLMIYGTALDNRLHVASLRNTAGPMRIVDVGFGTGFWMTEIAAQYPHAEVIGFDLGNSTAGTPPVGHCDFRSPVDFVRHRWPVDDGSVDLVHMAQLCGSVPSWPDLYGQAFRALRPGVGQIEHIEVDWTPRTTQSTFPPEANQLAQWWNWMLEASRRSGKSLQYRDDTEALLERSGFVDVSHKAVRVPLYCQNRKDPREWSLAHNYQTAMGYIGSQSFTGFSMALFTRYFNMDPAAVREFCRQVLGVVNMRGLPLYINLHGSLHDLVAHLPNSTGQTLRRVANTPAPWSRAPSLSPRPSRSSGTA